MAGNKKKSARAAQACPPHEGRVMSYLGPPLLSLDDALAALPVRKSRRWLNEFLNKTKTDPTGQPLYRQAGRDKLVYITRLIEAFACPLSSKSREKTRARTIRSGARTSVSEWTRAAALLDDPSLLPSSSGSRGRSSAESTHPRRPHLVVSNPRS